MSNIAIKGADTGTGVFTLESPATNTNRTLVLPDEAGTVLTTAGVPASALPAGSVIQTVFASYTTQTLITSTTKGSGTSTGLSATITPTSTNNKLLLLGSISFANVGYVSDPGIFLEVFNGSSVVWTDEFVSLYANGDGSENISSRQPLMVQVTPTTTASTTYTIRAWRTASGNWNAHPSGNPGTLVIMEIAG